MLRCLSRKPRNNFKDTWGYVRVLGNCKRMTLATKSMILIVFLVLVHNAVCSHFRGGTFTYTPVNPSDPANTTVSSLILQNASVYNWAMSESNNILFRDFCVHDGCLFHCLYCGLKQNLLTSLEINLIPLLVLWSNPTGHLCWLTSAKTKITKH